MIVRVPAVDAEASGIQRAIVKEVSDLAHVFLLSAVSEGGDTGETNISGQASWA